MEQQTKRLINTFFTIYMAATLHVRKQSLKQLIRRIKAILSVWQSYATKHQSYPSHQRGRYRLRSRRIVRQAPLHRVHLHRLPRPQMGD